MTTGAERAAIIDALRGALIDLGFETFAGDPSKDAVADLLDRLDAAGLRLISARLPELRESRATNVTLAQYQQILGERNVLATRVAALEAFADWCRDRLQWSHDDPRLFRQEANERLQALGARHSVARQAQDASRSDAPPAAAQP